MFRSSILRPCSLGAVALSVALLATACTASESVTITDDARTEAAALAAAAQPEVPAVEPTAPPATAVAPTPTAPSDEPTPQPTAPSDNTDGSTTTSATGCTYLGVDDFGDMQIELQFQSDVSEAGDARALYVVLDGRSPIVESSAFIEQLQPGELVRVRVDTVTDVPNANAAISCEFVGIEQFAFPSERFAPGSSDRCVFVEVDTFDDIQVRLDVTNPLPTSTDLVINFALRGTGGERFGGGTGITTDAVAPGEQFSLPADSFTEVPPGLDEVDVSCEILSIEPL